MPVWRPARCPGGDGPSRPVCGPSVPIPAVPLSPPLLLSPISLLPHQPWPLTLSSSLFFFSSPFAWFSRRLSRFQGSGSRHLWRLLAAPDFCWVPPAPTATLGCLSQPGSITCCSPAHLPPPWALQPQTPPVPPLQTPNASQAPTAAEGASGCVVPAPPLGVHRAGPAQGAQAAHTA